MLYWGQAKFAGDWRPHHLLPFLMKALSVYLSDTDLAALQAKRYLSPYTQIPNSALGPELRRNLNRLYQALTDGETLADDDFTFTVRADEDGQFKALYSPCLCRISDAADAPPVIRWGLQTINVLSAPKAPLRFSFTDKVMTPNYTATYFNVSLAHDSVLLTLQCPVFQANFELPVRADVLSATMDAEPQNLAGMLGVFGSSSTVFRGFVVKPSQLPLGDWQLIGVKTYEGGQYGPAHVFQAVVPPERSFTAMVNEKDSEGNWTQVEKRIEGLCKVKANAALKRAMAAKPVITEEAPATLSVLEHGEFNGYPTAKVSVEFSMLEPDDNRLSLNF